jgi:hypothetical protein
LRLVKILELQNDIEANLLDAVLTDKQIPHVIRSLHDTAYDGLMQAQTGCWGWVEAPEEEREAIASLYGDIVVRRAEHELVEDDEENTAAGFAPAEPGKKKKQPNAMFWGVLFLLAGLMALGVILLVSGYRP